MLEDSATVRSTSDPDHSDADNRGATNTAAWPAYNNTAADAETQDHFICENGVTFAGHHLIVDFWGATQLDDLDHMEQAMRDAVEASHATLLHIHLHHFTPNGGISGVAVLAESHISVHTWPEKGFAAFDVFMCGDASPQKAVDALTEAFKPERLVHHDLQRGRSE